MFKQLFNTPPLVDEETLVFMQSLHRWALEQFGSPWFNEQVQLVLPTNAFFPERISNVEEMAARLLERMADYSGLTHWPLAVTADVEAPLQLPSGLPAPNSQAAPPTPSAESIPLRYNPQQASDPQGMIASHAQQLGALLAAWAPEPPPVSPEQLPLVAELLAVHLGYGVPMANTAFRFAGGCGGCGSTSGRVAYLNQDEALMALALFCHHKGIAPKQVGPHLQSHLRGLFKRALRQLD